MRLELAEASRPMPGQKLSGDACCALPCQGGMILAAVDALGHGPMAAQTAGEAIQALKDGALRFSALEELLPFCHERLKKTRGVAMSLALFKESEKALSWTGVGNVEGLFLRNSGDGGLPARERLLLKGGVVGYQLPPYRGASLLLRHGDALIFATDGIKGDFCEGASWRSQSPREMADAILRGFDSGTDDALVWALRFTEG